MCKTAGVPGKLDRSLEAATGKLAPFKKGGRVISEQSGKAVESNREALILMFAGVRYERKITAEAPGFRHRAIRRDRG